MSLDKQSKIYVAGHRGMAGSAIVRLLEKEGYTNLLKKSSSELDLKNTVLVNEFFQTEKPAIVILAAAKVGGIQANIDNPATFLYDNLVIQNNVVEASYRNGVDSLIFLGSSCIYPKECPQPMKEEYLLDGKLEPTNEGYALAKIAGIKLLEGYKKQYGFNSVSLMPCNLYGPNDSFDLKHSHVLSALVKRFTDARDNNDPTLTVWGTGIAEREFMHVDDLARSVLFMMERFNHHEFINVGWGEAVSIKELAETIASKVGYKGEICWDASKPDGMLRKCMDITRITEMGFTPEIDLSEGIDQMIGIYAGLKASGK